MKGRKLVILATSLVLISVLLLAACGQQAPAPAPAPAASQTVSGTGQVATANAIVNVRNGAGTDWTRIGAIFPGTPYPVLGEGYGWVNIDFNGRSGWVWGGLVTLSAGAPVQTAANGLEANVIANVRNGAGPDWTRIGAIFPGTVYPITGEQFGWYSFDFNGRTGWVWGGLVTVH